MKIIANGINGEYLKEILLNAPKDIEWVKAAVAYANGTPELIEHCVDNKVPLTFYGRMDESIPVSLNILERFLKLGPSYSCKLVWKHYHPKVIWFLGYGVYIGSANLNSTSWWSNIECGVWFSESDIQKQNLVPQLQEFFAKIDQVAEPLRDELLARLKEIESLHFHKAADIVRAQKELEQDFDKKLSGVLTRKFSGLSRVVPKDAAANRKREFLQEWSDTLQLLRKISEIVSLDENRPAWIKADVPKGVQVDQFLHAFYYNEVMEGNRARHLDFHERNKSRTDAALKEAMQWWKNLEAAPSEEDEYINNRAPFIFERLSRQNLLRLTQDEFVAVCTKINAFRTAARQTSNADLGLPEGTNLDIDERAKIVANWIWDQESANGSSVLQVIYHVLYDGPVDSLTDRLWDVVFDNNWHLPRFGLSSIGEMVGWAMPTVFPPRNGRTSKALYALGYEVTIHST